LHEELNRWKSQFAEKYGADSVSSFDATTDVTVIAGALV